MKSKEAAGDIAALLRARNPLLWIVTKEEARVEGYIFEAAASASYLPRTWDVAQGFAKMDGSKEAGQLDNANDPGTALSVIQNRASAKTNPERGVWIMRDLPIWLGGPAGAAPLRQLRNLARMLPGTARDWAQAIIILSPSGEVPPELSGHVTMIEWPLPDREEIATLLDTQISALPDLMKTDAAPNGMRDAAIDAAVGLSGEEAQSCFARSLVQHRRIDPPTIAREKKRVIARERVLDWYDPLPGGLDAVGGLENLKAWLRTRQSAYTQKARDYGLPAPKGAMLVGVPGCGKSLTAKAIATAWGVPLLRLDLGALKSKFVGDSEANLRKAFRVIEAIGRCVVWLDEIEKALGGAVNGGADGGVSTDALGGILSWMQERQGEAFVIATANDVSALPPELLRKGRFDELWFVDLPNPVERHSIIIAALKAHGRDGTKFSLLRFREIVAMTEGFTGAEIAALIPDALYAAFADEAREPTEVDLVDAARNIVPLSKTASEKIKALREWASTRARAATATFAETKTPPLTASGRNIDV